IPAARLPEREMAKLPLCYSSRRTPGAGFKLSIYRRIVTEQEDARSRRGLRAAVRCSDTDCPNTGQPVAIRTAALVSKHLIQLVIQFHAGSGTSAAPAASHRRP